eukprot:GHVH01004085.1.p1 GENE.GHVH01004085.1~~GHVH01004085.1.p1  ORF type:complete len:1213 (+),score=170.94 GHVH01004085.1:45-3683(+)
MMHNARLSKFEALAETAYTSNNNDERRSAEQELLNFLNNDDAVPFCVQVLKEEKHNMNTIFCAAWSIKTAVVRKWVRSEDVLNERSAQQQMYPCVSFANEVILIMQDLWLIITAFPRFNDPMEEGRFAFNQIISTFATLMKKGIATESPPFQALLEEMVSSLSHLLSQEDPSALIVVLLTLTEISREVADSQLLKLGIKWKAFSLMKKEFENRELLLITRFAINALPCCLENVVNEMQLKCVLLLTRFLDTFADWDFATVRSIALAQDSWFQPTDVFRPLMIPENVGEVNFFMVVSECYKRIRSAAADPSASGYVHETSLTLRNILTRLGRFKARRMLAGPESIKGAVKKARPSLQGALPNFDVTLNVSLPLFVVFTDLIKTEQAYAEQMHVSEVEEELSVLVLSALSLVENSEVNIVTFCEHALPALTEVYLPLVLLLMTTLSIGTEDLPSIALTNALDSCIRIWSVVFSRFIVDCDERVTQLKGTDLDLHTLALFKQTADTIVSHFVKNCLISVDQLETDDSMQGGDDETGWCDKFITLINSLRPIGVLARLSASASCSEVVAKLNLIQSNVVTNQSMTTKEMDELIILVLFAAALMVETSSTGLFAEKPLNVSLQIPSEFITLFRHSQTDLEALFLALVNLFTNLLDKFQHDFNALGQARAVQTTGLSSHVIQAYLLAIGQISMAYLCQNIRYIGNFKALTEDPGSLSAMNAVVNCLVRCLVVCPSEVSVPQASADVLHHIANPTRPTALYLWSCTPFHEVANAIGVLGVEGRSGPNRLQPLLAEVHAETLRLLADSCGTTCCSFEASRQQAKELQYTGRLERSGTMAAQELISGRQTELLNCLSPFVEELFAEVDRHTGGEGISSTHSLRIGLWMNMLSGLVEGAMRACRHTSFLDNASRQSVNAAMSSIRSTFVMWISQSGRDGKTIPIVLANHAKRLIDSPSSEGFCHAVRLLTALCGNVMHYASDNFKMDCVTSCLSLLDAIRNSLTNIIATDRLEEIFVSLLWFFKLCLGLLGPCPSSNSESSQEFAVWAIRYSVSVLNSVTPLLMGDGSKGVTLISVQNGRPLLAYLKIVQLVFESDIGRKAVLGGDLESSVMSMIMDLANVAATGCRATQGRLRFVGICVETAIISACRELVCENGLMCDSVVVPAGQAEPFEPANSAFSVATIAIAKLCLARIKLILEYCHTHSSLQFPLSLCFFLQEFNH